MTRESHSQSLFLSPMEKRPQQKSRPLFARAHPPAGPGKSALMVSSRGSGIFEGESASNESLLPSTSLPLGSAAVAGNISTNAAVNASFSTFSSDPLKWNVLDWLRAFNSAEDATSFNGKQADVIGFVYREASFADDQFMVARFTISCCVADASAIGLPVIWEQAGDFPQDTWVRVQGAFEVGQFRGDTVPVLHATSVETVEQPEHPYLYP